MKARFAKKIWNREVKRYSPYWYCQVWDYVAKLKRDHRIEKAKRIVMKRYGKGKQIPNRGGEEET